MVFTSVSFAFRAWSGLPGLHRRYVGCQPHLFADPQGSGSASAEIRRPTWTGLQIGFFRSRSQLPPDGRPLTMDCPALLSVVSQLLSVCVPSGCRRGATPRDPSFLAVIQLNRLLDGCRIRNNAVRLVGLRSGLPKTQTLSASWTLFCYLAPSGIEPSGLGARSPLHTSSSPACKRKLKQCPRYIGADSRT